ncbi:MAG: DUF6311 domain-containing protein [Myxococcota bacterium]
MTLTPRGQLAVSLSIVSAFGLGWYLALGGGQTINPTNVSWMLEGDWMGHLFGWLFTRNGPWALPLASAPDLVHPAGSSAALTDAIPLAAVVAKLFSPLAPEAFQYFGLWMLLGTIGLGVAGVLVLRPHVKDPALLTLGGMLCVMNPIVSTRYGHPPFYGFWALTGLVGLSLWPVAELKSARRVAGAALVLGFLGCAMNAYLALMASGLMFAAVVRLALVERRFSRREGAAWVAATPAVAVLSLWLFGFISGARSSPVENLAIEGFGQFSADPFTFVNPFTWSRFLPALPVAPRQYEGYAYLGLGILALLAFRLALLARFRPSRDELKSLAPLLLVALVMAFYALSNQVIVGGRLVAHLDFYDRLAPLPSIFRSSGRFVWPLHVLLTLTAILGAARLTRIWLARVVLGLAFLVQVIDFNVATSTLGRPAPEFRPFRAPEWKLLGQDYRHLYIHPVQINWTCPFNPVLVAKLSWEAYRQRLTINSGHVGRAPPGTNCTRHLAPAELDPQTVYIPYFQEYYPDFATAGWVCGVLEGVPLCVSPARETALKQLLQQRAFPR